MSNYCGICNGFLNGAPCHDYLREAEDEVKALRQRLALADKILDLLTAYNVGMSFISEEQVQPLWEAYRRDQA